MLRELIALLAALDIHPRTATERSRTYAELREWSSIKDEGKDEGEGNAGEGRIGADVNSTPHTTNAYSHTNGVAGEGEVAALAIPDTLSFMRIYYICTRS